MIRDYKKSDWDQVRQIYDLSKPDEMKGIVDPDLIIPLDKDPKMLQYFKESQIWVYENKHQLIGFIGLKGNVVSWLFVHPDNRRQGIAGKLLANLINECNHSLKLNMVKSNHAAMSLYLDMGFTVSEEFQGEMYGQKIPAVRLMRNSGSEPVVSPAIRTNVMITAISNKIQEMIDLETKGWNTKNPDLFLSMIHPDMAWPWPPTADAHDPIDWIFVLGRFDRERWRKSWQDLFDSHDLVHNRRHTVRIEISKEQDAAFAVVDIDTLWRHKVTREDSHWLGRVCKIYTKLSTGEWKFYFQTGALNFPPK